jgi:Arc/MetJ-type ribon-helix-helix transcriptional regulator
MGLSGEYHWRVRLYEKHGDFDSMTIHLSKDQERFVHEAVRAGLYTSEDAVVRDALDRLRQAIPTPVKATPKAAKRTKAAPQKKNLTIAEIHQQMLASGLMSQLPDTAADFDDPDDVPITIKGEPLSETIIRERR